MVSFIFERAAYAYIERLVISPRGYEFQFLGDLQTYYITRIKQMAFGRERMVKPSKINQELIMGFGPSFEESIGYSFNNEKGKGVLK